MFLLMDKKMIIFFVKKYLLLSHESDIMPCNKIDKILVVYRFSNNNDVHYNIV